MINANLYLKEIAKDTYEVILSAPPVGAKTGIAVQWPVDPESTWETGIIIMLYRTGKFEGKRFKHSKFGIVTGIRPGIYPLMSN